MTLVYRCLLVAFEVRLLALENSPKDYVLVMLSCRYRLLIGSYNMQSFHSRLSPTSLLPQMHAMKDPGA